MVEMDLSIIDMDSIYDWISLHKDSYAYSFFFYNGIFPDDYEYEDMQYEPYIEGVPLYLDAFEYGIHVQKDITNKGRQMNLAFSLEDEEKEKYQVKIPGEVDDPVLKLDIKTMKPSTGIFLGRLRLGEHKDEQYNIRIDFYKQGKQPILEIKVCNRNCA